MKIRVENDHVEICFDRGELPGGFPVWAVLRSDPEHGTFWVDRVTRPGDPVVSIRMPLSQSFLIVPVEFPTPLGADFRKVGLKVADLKSGMEVTIPPGFPLHLLAALCAFLIDRGGDAYALLPPVVHELHDPTKR